MNPVRSAIRRWRGGDPLLAPEPALEAVYRDLFLREFAVLGEEDGFFPVGGAANHSLLYLILRIAREFRPRSVLDIGAGQSSLLWSMLARHGHVGAVLTLEDDAGWGEAIGSRIDHPMLVTPLSRRHVEGRIHATYDWFAVSKRGPFDVIVCDGPRGTARHSRGGVVHLLDRSLPSDFVLVLDDCERPGEQDTVDMVHERLDALGIDYEAGVTRAAKTQVTFAAGRYRPATFL